MNKWIALAVLALAAAGCKQGVGDRCQLNSDCTSGNCSPSDQRCVEVVPVDSEIVGVPDDAPIDARPDAPPVDASTVNAP